MNLQELLKWVSICPISIISNLALRKRGERLAIRSTCRKTGRSTERGGFLPAARILADSQHPWLGLPGLAGFESPLYNKRRRLAIPSTCRKTGRSTERGGFEPPLELPLNMISNHAPSTTRPSLQLINFTVEYGFLSPPLKSQKRDWGTIGARNAGHIRRQNRNRLVVRCQRDGDFLLG